MTTSPAPTTSSRRDFLKRAAYVSPALLTLPCTAALAQVGSGAVDCPPPPFGPPTANACVGQSDATWIPRFDENGCYIGCTS